RPAADDPSLSKSEPGEVDEPAAPQDVTRIIPARAKCHAGRSAPVVGNIKKNDPSLIEPVAANQPACVALSGIRSNGLEAGLAGRLCRQVSHSFADLIGTGLPDGSYRDRHRPPQVVDREDQHRAANDRNRLALSVEFWSPEWPESALCSRWLTMRRMGEDAPFRTLPRLDRGWGAVE